MYSKVKVLGHPLHPMLIAFPVAFYTLTFVAFIIYAIAGNLLWFQVGTIATWAGVITAVGAAIPGFIDWSKGIPDGTRAKATGRQHMILNLSALAFFFLNGIIQSNQWGSPAPGALAGVLLSLIGLGFTMRAGFLGWSLVQKHHVGVDLTPAQERLESTITNGHRGGPRPIREQPQQPSPDR